MSGHDDQGAYLPTPRRIRAEATAISDGWDAKTRHKRRVTDDLPEPWTVPEVCTTNTARPGVRTKHNKNVDERGI